MINNNKIKEFLKEICKFSLFVLAVIIGNLIVLVISAIISSANQT